MQIQSELEYESALKRIDELWGADTSTLEGQELNALFLAVESYEDEHYLMDEPKSYAAIAFHLERLGLSVDELPISPDEKKMLADCITKGVLVPEVLTVKISRLLNVPRDVFGLSEGTTTPVYPLGAKDTAKPKKNLPLHPANAPSKSNIL